MYVCTTLYVHNVSMYIHVYMFVCMYVYMYVRIYVCTYLLCMYVCTYVCMYICMYVCMYMYVCTYVYVCMFISMYSGTIRVVYQGEASPPMGIGSQNFNAEPGVDFNNDVMSIDMGEGVASTVIEIPVIDVSL